MQTFLVRDIDLHKCQNLTILQNLSEKHSLIDLKDVYNYFYLCNTLQVQFWVWHLQASLLSVQQALSKSGCQLNSSLLENNLKSKVLWKVMLSAGNLACSFLASFGEKDIFPNWPVLSYQTDGTSLFFSLYLIQI